MRIQNELTAMAETYAILSQLTLGEQNRVIDWLKSKVNEQTGEGDIIGLDNNDFAKDYHDSGLDYSPANIFSSFAGILQYRNLKELLKDINLKSSSDKTLLAAAFLKAKRGMDEFKARDISNALKEIGESVPNITLSVQQLLKKDLLKYIEGAKQGKRLEKKLEFTEFGEEIIQRAIENKELMLRRLR